MTVVAAPAARKPVGPTGATGYGLAMAFTMLLMGLSTFRAARLEVSGLLVHPATLAVAVLFFFRAPDVPKRFPRKALGLFALFYGVFVVSCLSEPRGASEIVKVGASIVTIILVPTLVSTERDFRIASTALILAAAFIGARALGASADSGVSGINPMAEVGNKNSYSLYALPALLCAGHVVLDHRAERLLRIICVVGVLACVLALFSTANRSGWLGVPIVIGTLAIRRGARARNIVTAVALAGIVAYVVSSYASSDVIAHKLEQTQGGYGSDTLRWQLFEASVRIGLENPLLGVSPQRLEFELARRVPSPYTHIDPHNAIALLLGGSGVPALLLFVAAGWSLWARPPSLHATNEQGLWAHGLVRGAIVVIAYRGQFSREILYMPAVAFALGLAIALSRVHGAWAVPEAQPLTWRQRAELARRRTAGGTAPEALQSST